jgi:glycogen operon protein
LATLVLSQGVPMLLAGDEIAHTQHGNNNAYCQDNEITWLPWSQSPKQQQLLQFVKRLYTLANEQPVLHRRRFFQGKSIRGEAEIKWLEPSGREMSDEAWNASFVRCLGVHLAGGKIDVDEFGEPIVGDHILMLFNADHAEKISFVFPQLQSGRPWELLFDTADAEGSSRVISGRKYDIQPCSMAVFRSTVLNDGGMND